MDDISFILPHPSSIILAGPSSLGKSHLAFDIVKRRNELFSEPIEKVTYVYGEFQPQFYDLQSSDSNVKLTDDLFEIDQIKFGPHLIILDDIQTDLTTDKKKRELVTNVFVRGSHHRSISVVLILQNPFAAGLRDVAINSQVNCIWDFPRDRSIMSNYARQVCPGKTRFLQEAYNDAVSRSDYGYLVLLFHPQLKKDKYWVRSSLFPSSDTVAYAE